MILYPYETPEHTPNDSISLHFIQATLAIVAAVDFILPLLLPDGAFGDSFQISVRD